MEPAKQTATLVTSIRLSKLKPKMDAAINRDQGSPTDQDTFVGHREVFQGFDPVQGVSIAPSPLSAEPGSPISLRRG